VSRVASVTARVLLGVLMGKVRFDEKRSELQFNDPKLAQDVEHLEIAPIIQKSGRVGQQSLDQTDCRAVRFGR